MKEKLKKNKGVFDVLVTAVSAGFSVGTMIYAVAHFGLQEAWPELVLNLLYIACLIMMWMYFFKIKITATQFNYWCTVFVGVAVLLRDILFPPPLAYYAMHLVCLVLAVMLLVTLTYFYARRQWKTYSKNNLWLICMIDMVIATIYMIAIYLEPINDYTAYLLTEIWIRPTITYGMVVCFVLESEREQEA